MPSGRVTFGVEIQNVRRALLPCRDCGSFALRNAPWPSGFQGLRHVADLCRNIGPYHEKQPYRWRRDSVTGPEKTKVEERQGQSQSLIRDCFVVIRLRLLTIARAEEFWSDGLRRLIPQIADFADVPSEGTTFTIAATMPDNAALAVVGYNFRLPIKWLRIL
jgi:hypothetical protein